MRAYFLSIMLLACTAQSQDLRPVTRVGPGCTLVVSDVPELMPSLEQAASSFTAVRKGDVRVDAVRRYVRLSLDTAAKERGTQLAAKLERPVEPGSVYLPGSVSGLEPFIPEKRRIYFWGTDTLDPVLPSENRELRLIWKRDGYGDRVLVLQEFDDRGLVRGTREYHTRRSECLAQQRDGISVVRCQPDYRHADTEPAFVLVMVNGEAIQIWREPADTVGRELLAVHTASYGRALVFSTGEVLHHVHNRWRLESAAMRDP